MRRYTNKMQSLGVFSEPSYITVGEPFDRRHLLRSRGHVFCEETSRARGRQILSEFPTSSQHSSKAYFGFDSFKYVSDGGCRESLTRQQAREENRFELSQR